jgi:hypothetical protein
MQKGNEEYIDQMSSNIIKNRKELTEKLAELDVTEFATAEEY